MEKQKKSVDFVEEFRQYLLEDGKSTATIASYVGDVAGFIGWLTEKGHSFDGNLSRFFVTSFRKYLVESGFEVATINKKVNSLQSFNGFLIDKDYTNEQSVDVKRDKVKVAQGSEQEVTVLSEEETERLLFHIQDEKKVSKRDRVMVILLLYIGVRVSELVNLRLRDVDCLGMSLKIQWGKGGKMREVPLRSEATEAIRGYLEKERKESKHGESEYLLLTQRAGKMDRDTVNKVLNRMGKATGLNLHPHLFRHTFCTRLLQRNVPITTVAKLAGHAGIQTTASFYINTSQRDKRNAVDLL